MKKTIKLALLLFSFVIIFVSISCYKGKGLPGIPSPTGGGDDPALLPAPAQNGMGATNGTYTDKIMVNWSEVPKASKYNIYRCEAPADGNCDASGLNYVKIDTVLAPQTYYEDKTALADTKYCYKIAAVDAQNLEGEKSSGVLGSEVAAYPLTVTPAWQASSTASNGIYTDRVHLEWSDVTGADGYEIYRCEAVNGVCATGSFYKKIVDIPVSSVTRNTLNNKIYYDDTSVQANKIYCYQIKPYQLTGDPISPKQYGDGSTPVQGWSVSGYTQQKSEDSTLGVDANNASYPAKNGSVKFIFGKVAGAEKYYIYRADGAIINYYFERRVVIISGTGVETIPDINQFAGYPAQDIFFDSVNNKYVYYDSSVQFHTSYFYKVRSWANGTGFSDATAPIEGKLPEGTESLSAPATFSAEDGVNLNKVVLNWTASVGASSYVVKRYDSDCVTAVQTVGSGKITGTSVEDNGLNEGVKYCYSIQAFDDGGNYSPPVTDTGFRKLSAPQSIAATKGTSETDIAVSGYTHSKASQYKIYRATYNGTSCDGSYSEIVLTPSTSYADSGASVGTMYCYKAQAVSTDTGVSDLSAAWDFGFRKISAPANISAGDGSSTSLIHVTWDSVSGATGYKLYRSTDNYASPVYTGASASFDDSISLTAGKIVAYKVKAVVSTYTSNNDSDMSTSSDTGFMQLSAPEGVTVVENVSSLSVSWTAVAGDVSSYDIYRAPENSGGTEGTYELLDPNLYAVVSLTSIDDNSAPWGEKFYYKVQAKNSTSGALSAFSTPVSGKRTTVSEGAYKSLGTEGFSTYAGKYTSIQFYQGVAYVAYNQPTDGKIYVKKYDKQNGWVDVGDIAITDAHSYALTKLSVRNHSEIYVAYGRKYVYGDAESHKVKVKKYNGSVWSDLGAVGVGQGDMSYHYSFLAMALNSSGIPYIAFRDSSDQIFVKKYNSGTTWDIVGGGKAGDGYSQSGGSYIDLYIKDDVPYITYISNDTGTVGRLIAKKQNGAVWESLGEISSSPASSYGVGSYTHLYVVSLSEIYAAFCHSDGYIYVMKYNGTTWSQLGTKTVEKGTRNSMKVVDGVVYLGYQAEISLAYKAKIIKYKTSWANVGGTNGDGIVGTLSSATDSFLSIDFYSGSIYAAFTDYDKSGKITVKY